LATSGLFLVGFVVLAVARFAVAATTRSFWKPEHSTAPVATAVYLMVLAALVLGRYGWAWVVLVLLNAAVLVGWAFDSRRFQLSALWHLLSVATLLLLLFAPMRHRLRRTPGLQRVGRAEPT